MKIQSEECEAFTTIMVKCSGTTCTSKKVQGIVLFNVTCTSFGRFPLRENKVTISLDKHKLSTTLV